MRNRIASVLKEMTGLEDEVETVEGLITNGYLDSFSALMLINTLELEYNINFDFDDNIYDNLDSLDKIEKLILSKL